VDLLFDLVITRGFVAFDLVITRGFVAWTMLLHVAWICCLI